MKELNPIFFNIVFQFLRFDFVKQRQEAQISRKIDVMAAWFPAEETYLLALLIFSWPLHTVPLLHHNLDRDQFFLSRTILFMCLPEHSQILF